MSSPAAAWRSTVNRPGRAIASPADPARDVRPGVASTYNYITSAMQAQCPRLHSLRRRSDIRSRASRPRRPLAAPCRGGEDAALASDFRVICEQGGRIAAARCAAAAARVSFEEPPSYAREGRSRRSPTACLSGAVGRWAARWTQRTNKVIVNASPSDHVDRLRAASRLWSEEPTRTA